MDIILLCWDQQRSGVIVAIPRSGADWGFKDQGGGGGGGEGGGGWVGGWVGCIGWLATPLHHASSFMQRTVLKISTIINQSPPLHHYYYYRYSHHIYQPLSVQNFWISTYRYLTEDIHT